MITSLEGLLRQAATQGDRAAIVSPEAVCTWGELIERIDAAAAKYAALEGARVGVVHRGDGATWSLLAALERLKADVFLLSESLSETERQSLHDEFGFVVTIDPGAHTDDHVGLDVAKSTLKSDARSRVTILTSGTSGRPKAAQHTWETLSRPVRIAPEIAGTVWLLTYRPNLYAGLQVALQCLAGGGTLVYPGGNAPVETIIDLLVQYKVAFVSATPSYWRRLLIFGDQQKLRTASLRQITLGGELIDQQILDMLHDTFLASRLIHIYATTELGRCFSVTDGQAGFPTRFLGALSPDGVEMKIVNDELYVRSTNAMQGYQSGTVASPQSEWFATGDVVQCEGDRCFFAGRKSDIINVGGNKVSPQEVERVLRTVPGVADIRVFAKSSSVAGQLVAAQVVASKGADAGEVKSAVIAKGLSELASHQRPRLVEMVEQLELSDAGKMVRR